MKVLVALIGLLVVVTAELPSGRDYFGDYLCQLMPPGSESPDASCDTCTGSDDCGAGSSCCPSSVPDCRTCSPGITVAVACPTDDVPTSPLEFTLDEEECEYCVCVGGQFFCTEVEMEEDSEDCPSLPAPTDGGSCMINDREILSGDMALYDPEDDCVLCVCGNGVLFCQDSDLCDISIPMCTYNEEQVAVGQTVEADDGCNLCTCLSDDNLMCTERDCECGENRRRVNCLRAPCDGAMCTSQPNATCFNDYCGGCNALWMIGEEDVTDRCSEVTPPEPVQPTLTPTCPHSDIDTCEEACDDDTPCPDDQICCRGCGSSCQVPVNLPSYELPLFCPPDTLSLSSDSATCDVECSFDDQCSGDKICCPSGCSRTCQTGYNPPNPCDLIRQQLTQPGQELLGRFIPRCMDGGYFAHAQTWVISLWCVNVKTGKPIGLAHSITDGVAPVCPNCTYNGEVYYAGQTFTDECNTCFCSETGVAACTERACLSPCTVPVSAGDCEDIQTRYFFNQQDGICERFQYTGCGGNANRFLSAGDCLEECLPLSTCLQEWDEGEPCDNEREDEARKDFYYYYDAEEGQCNGTLGYRCGGNLNRYQTGRECLQTCDPTNPGPTDIYGTPCWEIECDIPFCGDGVDPVYPEDHCCPTCPAESRCGDRQFQCRDGSCIPRNRTCDGLRDCDDDSDELLDWCDPSVVECEFYCSEDACIPLEHVCNGVPECPNHRDEVGCTTCQIIEEVPYYNIPPECPEATDVEGDCDVDQCTSESACEGDMCCNEGDLCCLNSCNQLSCATSRQPTYICSAIEQRLQGINTSYTPQCDSSGNFQPTQCMGDGDERRCWCVNTFNGIPLTNMSPDTNLNCRRCSYDGAEYYPGEAYTAADGCNTCFCDCNGYSSCTRIRCEEESCRVPPVNGDAPDSLEHGETREYECLTCTCQFGELNCTNMGECDNIVLITGTVRIELTFGGDLPEDIIEFERDVLRSFLQRYGESMALLQDQMEIIEVRQGSVIIVVEIQDKEDGANVTFLAYQVEDDFKDGVLVIRHGNEAYVPSGDVKVEMVGQGEEEDDDDEFDWVYGVIIGVGVAFILLLVILLTVIIFACMRKKSTNNKVEVDGNDYTSEVEMKKVPLDEA